MAEWRNLSQPFGACEMVNMTGMTINDLINWTHNSSHTMDMVKCDRFQFDSALSETTIQSEWDVVCDKATMLSVIEMCFLGGAATGSLSSGVMSDEYGRRHSLMLFVALQAVIGEHNFLILHSRTNGKLILAFFTAQKQKRKNKKKQIHRPMS